MFYSFHYTCISFVKFIPKYLILFGAMSEIILISFLNFSLLVCKNIIDFCILIIVACDLVDLD